MSSRTAYSLLLGVLVILVGVLIVLYAGGYIGSPNVEEVPEEVTVSDNGENESDETREEPTGTEALPLREVVAENLTIPWDIAFLPDGTMLVTERPGRVVHVERSQSYEVAGVEHVGEGGLLGLALHPDFDENRYVYLYQTTQAEGGIQNRVVRYTYEDDALTFDRVIFSGIPGASYHDGGRIAFGPDGLLYITTGDAGTPAAAQDRDSLAGKILRTTDVGDIPEDNPFGTAVYSYGHRNPQGLAWDSEGRLWSTEHGRSGLRSGYDEINLIRPGENYGWPESEGDTVLEGTTAPVYHSGSSATWAPASALFWDGSLFFGGLRGETIYEAVILDEEVTELKEHYAHEFGRIRTIVLGPDSAFYVTTSNRDGRGDVREGDDRIIRLDPAQFRE